jgi:hypothetical protein
MFNFRPPSDVPGFRVEVPDDPPGFRVGNNGESQRATPAQFRQPFVDLFPLEPPQFPAQPVPSGPGLTPDWHKGVNPLGLPPGILKNPGLPPSLIDLLQLEPPQIPRPVPVWPKVNPLAPPPGALERERPNDPLPRYPIPPLPQWPPNWPLPTNG